MPPAHQEGAESADDDEGEQRRCEEDEERRSDEQDRGDGNDDNSTDSHEFPLPAAAKQMLEHNVAEAFCIHALKRNIRSASSVFPRAAIIP